MTEHPALILALILLAGVSAQWLAWWLKLPAILFLLTLGVVAGPLTHVLDPDALLGDLLFPLVSLGVAVILFEGSLTLRFQDIKGLERAVRGLVSIGALINWLAMSFAAAWLMGFAWPLALLFGALVTVTGPTVIAPMLRTVRPVRGVAQTLRWEGIIIDPLGALLAVLVFEAIVSGQQHNPLWVFAKVVLIGGASGALAAWLLAVPLRRRWLPDYLHNVVTLSLVLTAFTVANALQEESGLLAVTVMGIMLANLPRVEVEDILDFKESLSLLLISGLFIVLAARIEFAQFHALGWNAVYLLLAILFITRPLAVWLSTLRSGLNWREKSLLCWIAPRGIVAAAVTPLFVAKIDPAFYAGEELLVPLVFSVIATTVVLQGLTARLVAQLLRVAEPEPRGVLIVGANPVARAIAKALQEQGYDALLADTTWSHLRDARMAGLKTYFGNVVSAHADRHLDLVGLGRLFALSRHPALNALACTRYRNEFGSEHVYALRVGEDNEDDTGRPAAKRSVTRRFRGRPLFGADVTYAQINRLLQEGGGIRATVLSEDFDFADYVRRYHGRAVELLALDPEGLLHVFTGEEETPLHPEPGWTVISLLPAGTGRSAKTGDSERKAAREQGRTEAAKRPRKPAANLP